MNRSTFSHILICFALTIGFLHHYNSAIHEDFNSVMKEIKLVDDQLEQRLNLTHLAFEILSKKKERYKLLREKCLTLNNDAWFTLKTSEIITEEIYNIDKEELQKKLHPYYETAINSKDSILAINYMKMALIERVQHLSDSIFNTNKTPFTTSLITMNEPDTYKVGEIYPLYFATINTINIAERNNFEIYQRDKQIELSQFPLIYDAPIKTKFNIRSKNGSHNFLFDLLYTRNHKQSKFTKP